MQCMHNVPYASWRLTVFRQLFTPSLPTRLSSSPRRTISSTTQSQAQAQHHQKDTAQTEQPNHDEPETSAPRPSDQLPQSPLLTSPHIRPVTRHRKRPPTTEEANALRNNPWAQALASPLRMCCITGARTPRDLLTTWGLVQRPESKGLWFLPVGLLKDELRGLQKKPSQSNSLQHVSVRMVDSIQVVRRLTTALASHTIGNFSALGKAIPYRMKHPQGPFTANHARALVWRQDMPEFVLGRIRLEAVKQLKKLSGRKHQDLDHENGVWRAIDIEGEVSEDALRKGLQGMAAFERMECGAMLVMREPQSEQNAADVLPQLVALPQTGSRVPVFDLSRLLSESEREELRRADPKFEQTALFFRPDDSVEIDALMALWKLRGFVNEELRVH